MSANSFSIYLLACDFRASLKAQLVKNPPAMQETLEDFWVTKIH